YINDSSSDIFIHHNDYKEFHETYLSLNETIRFTNLTHQTIRKVIKRFGITVISFGKNYNQKFISRKNIDIYILNNAYITIHALVDKLGAYEETSQQQFQSTNRSVIRNIKKSKELQKL